MKIKHKGQRNQGLTFQAELKLFSLCGPTSWCQQVICASSGDGLWHRLSGGQLPGRCTCGFRCSVGVSSCGLQRAVLCCSLTFSADGCDVGGDTLSSHSLAEKSHPPVCRNLHRRAPKPQGLHRFSQNPVITLPASVLLLVLCFYLRLLYPGLRIEKPPRSRHACKHMRDYLQARACVQVYPTLQSRDLDLGVGFSLVLRAGLRDLQKGWSNSSRSFFF